MDTRSTSNLTFTQTLSNICSGSASATVLFIRSLNIVLTLVTVTDADGYLCVEGMYAGGEKVVLQI